MSDHQHSKAAHPPSTDGAAPAFAGPWSLPAATRHDGWTGEVMARFCETLAETGVVVDACLAAGKGRASAYALRHRDPLFAAAWQAALGLARVQLSDALLARSIEGSSELYYKDGELVGEKRYFDNRLGLAVLKRLDRLAETGSPLPARPPHSVRPEPGRRTALSPAPAPSPRLDWDQMLGALRSGDPDAVAAALAALKSDETDKTDSPPDLSFSGPEAEPDAYVPERVWRDEEGGWSTDFPPPPGFDGFERGTWDDHGYSRSCTDEEFALLDAAQAIADAEERAADAAERDSYFADLAADVAEVETGEEGDDEATLDDTPPSSSPA